MNRKQWTRKALSACLVITLYATYSMVAFANTDKTAGELIINGKSQVTVNGEIAQSGRTVFSNSTIVTTDAPATVNVGKAGRLELAPNSSLTVNFDQNAVTGNLTAGTVTAIGSADKTVTINTVAGSVSTNNAPNNTLTVSAESATPQNADYEDCAQDTNNDGKKDCVCVDADKDGILECSKGGAAWWIWTAVFGGAAAGILWAALSSNDSTVGGGGTVVSPSR